MGDAPKGNGQVQLNPTVDFIAGTVAGMASLVVGFPFDTVKVRFQSPAVAGKYHSTFNAITTIIKEETFLGLYKGITSPLATVALMNGLVFASYRFLMKLQLDTTDSAPTLAQIALAGAGSGVLSSFITTPTELIKIRQQFLLTPTSARQVALQILYESGVRGLYRGITATALRDCGYGAYFFAYEATRRYFVNPSLTIDSSNASVMAQVDPEINSLSWSALILAGATAGIAGWLATFPLDVVKTRIQGSPSDYRRSLPISTLPYPVSDKAPRNPNSILQSRNGLTPEQTSGSSCSFTAFHTVDRVQYITSNNPYRSTWSTILYSHRTGGFGVFFRGLAPTLIRAIPVNIVTFTAFETVVHAFS